jgi:hypothetical protein
MPHVLCVHRWKKNNVNDSLLCCICDETWDVQKLKTPPEIIIGKIDVPEELYFGTAPRPLSPPKS